MKGIFRKGAISVLAFLFVIAPSAFYLIYSHSNSILWSSFAVLVAFVIWKLLVGGGLRKRRRFVDQLLAVNFPEYEEDPLGGDHSFVKQDWVKGIGFTDEQDQPMCSKATARGVALFYMCWAVKKPFLVPWDQISQVKLSEFTHGNTNQLLARLYITGIGMRVFVPWERRFNELIPQRVGFS